MTFGLSLLILSLAPKGLGVFRQCPWAGAPTGRLGRVQLASSSLGPDCLANMHEGLGVGDAESGGCRLLAQQAPH